MARRILDSLAALAEVGSGDLKKLKGYNPDRWRLRVGDYRAILVFDDVAHIAHVVRVLHRREAYRR